MKNRYIEDRWFIEIRRKKIMMWKDDLIVGVAIIDEQHKELCKAIDDLFEACKTGKGRDEVLKTMDFLQRYTVKHFSEEQVLQAKSGYPKVKEHKVLHDTFISKVAEIKAEIERDGANIVVVGKINSLIIDWLYNHIRRVDKELSQYIK